MEKCLVIYCHPHNPQSLSYSIKERVELALIKRKTQYKIIDLYKEKFNPILDSKDFISINQGCVLSDVQKYQLLIKDYKHIIFIFPLWWANMPAILKGWIDRVFSYGFAYEKNNRGDIIGTLGGISADLIITMGSKVSDYKDNGLYLAVKDSIKKGILDFCNVKTKKWFFCDGLPDVDSKIIENWLNNIYNYYINL